jgi:hypothetical protein
MEKTRLQIKNIPDHWSRDESAVLKKLDSPYKIQCFLDGCEYNSTPATRSPRYILKNKSAHCLEGAMFAAACLEQIGFLPLVVDMQAYDDDDHIIAVFKQGIYWGAVAKSNFTTLRYREPVYRSLRELVMSYFDFYFNTSGVKSLRGYSLPHNLQKFDKMKWRTTENDLEDIGYYLDKVKHIPLVNKEQISKLETAGKYLLESSLIGSNPAGLFIPGSEKKTR